MANSHTTILVSQLSSVCKNMVQKYSLLVAEISDTTLRKKQQQLNFLNTECRVHTKQDSHPT